MYTIETKKAQIALRKFQDVAQLHLDILKERRDNIRKYRASGDHKALSIEKSRADLVVKQLYDDVQQMFTWCSDLNPDTWEWVQSQMRPLNTRIQSALSDFMNECGEDELPRPTSTCDASKNGNNPFAEKSTVRHRNVFPDDKNHHDITVSSGIGNEMSQKQAVVFEELEQRRMEAEAHRQLLSDILELNEVMKEMDAVVRIQGEAVDQIENNVDRAMSNVDSGEKNLFKAMKYKVATYPIAGALIGAGAAAGPVGLLIGLKVAVVAAIGGSAVGAVSGHFLRKRALAESRNNLELRPLSATSPVLDSTSNRRKID